MSVNGASSPNDYFNPRSPCGERQAGEAAYQEDDGISIHAPRAGSDPEAALAVMVWGIFQSTLPVRGATGL